MFCQMGKRMTLPSSPSVPTTTTEMKIRPTDSTFLETLEEPLRSIGQLAIPPPSDVPLPSASSRADSLELKLRSHLLNDLLLRQPSSNDRADDDDEEEDNDNSRLSAIVQYWTTSLNLCVHLVHFCQVGKDERYHNMSVRKLPFVLLEDVLDGLSLPQTKLFWQDALEPNLDTIIFSPLMWKQSNICHLALLKACNKFLRLLDHDGEWCGRVMWTLSRGFGIADKSAMKLWGVFHSDNVTQYETEEDFKTAKATTTSTKSNGNDEVTVDYNLYQAFWSLQTDFSNPNRIQVADFLKKLRVVLAALESAHKSRDNKNDTSKPSGVNSKSSKLVPGGVVAESSKSTTAMTATLTPRLSTPKYLTSSGLLPLQLATPEFRIHLVTQFLIVAMHLSSESPPLAHALSSLQQRAKKLLEVDAPEQLRVLESIILKRELHWRTWKKTQKCTPTVFAPLNKTSTSSSSSPTGEDERKAKRPRLMDGPLTSSKHEEDETNMFELMDRAELIRVSKGMRDKIPSLEDHLEPYVEALDPEAGIEDEYHPKNDKIFCWQAMRLFAKHHLDRLHLVNCRGGGDFERLTRTVYQDKGREIPGPMPPRPKDELEEEKVNDDEEESPKEEEEEEAEPESQPESLENDEEDAVREDDVNDEASPGEDSVKDETPPEPMVVEEVDDTKDGQEEEDGDGEIKTEEMALDTAAGSNATQAAKDEGVVDKKAVDNDVKMEEEGEAGEMSRKQDNDDKKDAQPPPTKQKRASPPQNLPASKKDPPSKNQSSKDQPSQEQQQPKRQQQQHSRDDSRRGGGGGGGSGPHHGRRPPQHGRTSQQRRPSDDSRRQGDTGYGGGNGGSSRDDSRGGRSNPRFVPRPGAGRSSGGEDRRGDDRRGDDRRGDDRRGDDRRGDDRRDDRRGGASTQRDDRHRGSGSDRRGGRDDRDWRRHHR